MIPLKPVPMATQIQTLVRREFLGDFIAAAKAPRSWRGPVRHRPAPRPRDSKYQPAASVICGTNVGGKRSTKTQTESRGAVDEEVKAATKKTNMDFLTHLSQRRYAFSGKRRCFSDT